MVNLSTNYLGLVLKNPIVVSSSPLSHSIDSIRRLEDAGAAAVVMYSLFEEQIGFDSYYVDYHLTQGTDSYPESISYFPDMQSYNVGPDEYLNLVRRAKEAVNIPVIGSLNGASVGGWTDYATLIEEAGADALELNIYYLPTSTEMTGIEVEALYLDILSAVRQAVTIPLAVKLSPFFSSTANMAHRLVAHGADGLVLFNRFYQPDFDLENLEVTPRLVLSNSDDLRLPLRWVAILYGRLKADLAITSGIHTSQDVIKGLMGGAKVTMMASELLQNGMRRISQVLNEMCAWLHEREYESVMQLIGAMSQKHCAEPAAFERANYMKMLQSYRPLN
ncbi:MAG TPA: dihydroorotate dehydrogenase-like protein [Pyrinomonadaceae bacterium]|jgi:dihydroorotate dehydrogenase (fumarate)|nr:dihydroorotate dehydrogenase-like protein [Pyrinomonadaceae bacterium]